MVVYHTTTLHQRKKWQHNFNVALILILQFQLNGYIKKITIYFNQPCTPIECHADEKHAWGFFYHFNFLYKGFILAAWIRTSFTTAMICDRKLGLNSVAWTFTNIYALTYSCTLVVKKSYFVAGNHFSDEKYLWLNVKKYTSNLHAWPIGMLTWKTANITYLYTAV